MKRTTENETGMTNTRARNSVAIDTTVNTNAYKTSKLRVRRLFYYICHLIVVLTITLKEHLRRVVAVLLRIVKGRDSYPVSETIP